MTDNMSETLEVRILLLDKDRDTIVAFEKARLEKTGGDPMEKEMSTWSARWRPEALNHYLPQGWSFGAFTSDGKLTAYVLGQPFLFFRGLTQTLWLEHAGFTDREAMLKVLDVAHRWARDKHLQCVLMDGSPELNEFLKDWPAARAMSADLIEAKSARY